MERGVKYSSPGLLVELFQLRGLNFFLMVKLGPKKFGRGGQTILLVVYQMIYPRGGGHFFLVVKFGEENFRGGVKNSSHGHDLSTGRGSFFSRGDIGY